MSEKSTRISIIQYWNPKPTSIIGFDWSQKTCNIRTGSPYLYRLSSLFFFLSRHVGFALNILKMRCLLYISHEFGLEMSFFFYHLFQFSMVFQVASLGANFFLAQFGLGGHDFFGGLDRK